MQLMEIWNRALTGITSKEITDPKKIKIKSLEVKFRVFSALLFILSSHVESFPHVESHFFTFTPALLSILSSFLLK
jgi:hypothetical protein